MVGDVPTHLIYSSERVETRGPIVLYCSEYMRCETQGHASIVQHVRVAPGSVQYCAAQVKHVKVRKTQVVYQERSRW